MPNKRPVHEVKKDAKKPPRPWNSANMAIAYQIRKTRNGSYIKTLPYQPINKRIIMKTNIGSIKTGEEFIWGHLIYKRVGPLFNNIKELYPIRYLPYADIYGKWTSPCMADQNSIMVQEKESGSFFFMRCEIEVEKVNMEEFE